MSSLVTSGRSQEKRGKCNGNRYINHFYSRAVEAGFYGDAGRVVGSSTKLNNVDRG